MPNNGLMLDCLSCGTSYWHPGDAPVPCIPLCPACAVPPDFTDADADARVNQYDYSDYGPEEALSDKYWADHVYVPMKRDDAPDFDDATVTYKELEF